MANLAVRLLVRIKIEGKRSWVPATGNEAPGASYYTQHCVGSQPEYKFVGKDYAVAVAAKGRKERELKASSLGFVLPQPVDTKKNHRISDCLAAYIADLRLSNIPDKSIKGKMFEIGEFVKFCGKTYIETITRVDMMNYKNHLLAAGKADVTTYNKLMNICTFLKKNTVVSITGLLKAADWPKKRDTDPMPYTPAEQQAMMSAATPDERLLLRFFLGTGCREQEVAHVEITDIKDSYIQIQAKPDYKWSPKTDAGTRKIPLGDGLLQDLKNHCSSGLIFPNPNTGHVQGHFLRIIKDIATKAGVVGATCHRFRDTFATEQIRARVLDLRDVAKILGHNDLETIKLYAAFVDLASEQARKAANASDKFAVKPGPQLVKAS